MKKYSSRPTLAKAVLVGTALIVTQLSVRQFDVVRRVISEQLLDLPSMVYSSEMSIMPSRQDGHVEQLPELVKKLSNNTVKRNDQHLLNIPRKGYAEVPSSVTRNATSEETTKRRAKFHPDSKFSEALKDQFIQGAKDDAEIRAKRRQRAKLQRERNKKAKNRRNKNRKTIEKVPLKVPYPIFVPSLPKSGTTTTHKYFSCGGQNSVHLAGRTEDSIFKIGRCAQRNVEEGRAPFVGCGDYDVWTDTGMYDCETEN